MTKYTQVREPRARQTGIPTTNSGLQKLVIDYQAPETAEVQLKRLHKGCCSNRNISSYLSNSLADNLDRAPEQ